VELKDLCLEVHWSQKTSVVRASSGRKGKDCVNEEERETRFPGEKQEKKNLDGTTGRKTQNNQPPGEKRNLCSTTL